MGRRILIFTILTMMLAAVAVGSVFFHRNFVTTPSGCLFYVGRAIHDRNADLFFKYFDLRLVMNNFQPSARHDGHPLGKLVFNALDNLNQNAPEYIRRIIEDDQRPNLPGSFALLLSAQQGREENGQMQVMLPALNFNSRPVHFILARYPEENIWKVVEINHNDLEWLFLSYLGIDG